MNVDIGQSKRLPGGLTARRGWRAFIRAGGPEATYVLLLALLLLVLALVLDPVGLILVVALLVLAEFVARSRRPGAAVTARSQPEVHALVTDAARRIGVAPPKRVWLVGGPTVTARVTIGLTGRRRELRVGIPLLACLSHSQMAALIGHELWLLHHRRAWLVTRLWQRWCEATELAALYPGDDDPPPRWVRSVRTSLDAFATEVARQADGAAVTAAGGVELAARAFALARTAAREFDDYLTNVSLPPHRWSRLMETAIFDLDEGWRRRIGQGIAETGWSSYNAATLAMLHPILAEPLRTLGTAPLPLGEPAQPITVAPLGTRERRRVIRLLLDIPRTRYVRWRTFRNAPASWWLRRARRDAEFARKYAQIALGRPPVDDIETIQVVQTLDLERLTTVLGPPRNGSPTDVVQVDHRPHPVVVHLVEYALLRQGWRLEHPATRGVLVAPNGETVDAAKLLADAYATDAHLSGLRKLLQA